jgi:ATP-dependent Clp protease adapter protein ClpS
MEEVTDFLDTVAPLKERNMPSQPTDIRKLMNVLNELEVAEPTVARPPALDKEESPTDKPGGFNVVIFDDPVTPGYVVWEALMAVLRISQEEAIRRTTAAHDTGAVVATYSQEDVAQTIADRIMAHAQANTNWDFLRNLPNVPRYPRGPGGYQGPWPLQAEVMPAGN